MSDRSSPARSAGAPVSLAARYGAFAWGLLRGASGGRAARLSARRQERGAACDYLFLGGCCGDERHIEHRRPRGQNLLPSHAARGYFRYARPRRRAAGAARASAWRVKLMAPRPVMFVSGAQQG